MAGTGRAPKPKEQRRNKTQPSRGEWIDIGPLEAPVLPEAPDESIVWSDRTMRAWAAWRSDPVTSQYGPADIQAVIDLAFIYEEWVGGRNCADEVRQRQDRLGLNPKGKQDRRWRIVEDSDTSPQRRSAPASSSSRRARLSVVQ